MAVLGGIVATLTGLGGLYAGWYANVDQSVVQRQMVNAHDETLKLIVPKVDACHENNERQDVALNFAGETNARQDRAIERLADEGTRTNEMLQLYLQAMMKRGEIPR
jgi:hypothetical protein